MQTITVFNRLNAAAFIKFFEIRVQCLFEGDIYLREATERFNF